MTEPKRTLSEVDGVKVIATEPALGPHPRWPSQLVQRTGVLKVLLENGRECFVCDEGDYAADTVTSVVNHRNGTHNRTAPFMMYPAETVRMVIRESERERLVRVRGYCERTAELLNAKQVPTAKGGPWTPQIVSNIVNMYRDRYRDAVRESKKRHPAARQKATVTTLQPRIPQTTRRARLTSQVEDSTVFELVERLGDQLDDAQIMLERLAKKARELTVVDPETVAKAKKWDEMRDLMR